MRTTVEIKTTRNRAIESYLKKEWTIVSVLPKFATLFADFEKSNNLMEDLIKNYDLNTKGITVDKSILRKELSVNALEFSTKLSAMARFQENNSLLEEIHFTKSDLLKFADQEIIASADNLLKRGMEHIDELRAYGLTDQVISDFEKKIIQFREVRVDPRTARNNKAKIKTNIEEEFKNNQRILLDLDALLSIIQTTAPDVWKGYLSAKRMVKTGSRKINFRGRISDGSTFLPVPGVKIILTIAGNGNKPAFEMSSAPKGSFRLKSIPAGTYDLLATKKGYVPRKDLVTINEQGPTVVELELEREM